MITMHIKEIIKAPENLYCVYEDKREGELFVPVDFLAWVLPDDVLYPMVEDCGHFEIENGCTANFMGLVRRGQK